MLTKKQLASVYRQAAEQIAIKNSYSCCAVWDMIRQQFPHTTILEANEITLTDRYGELFRENDKFDIVCWLYSPTNISVDELQEFRIMALLFMAEMIEHGDI